MYSIYAITTLPFVWCSVLACFFYFYLCNFTSLFSFLMQSTFFCKCAYRPYALTSRLHNNDGMLGVKTCRAARTCCAGERWCSQPLSQCAGPGRPGGMACRGWPAGFMLGDGARDSASFDPQRAGAPFCDIICIRSIKEYYIYGLSVSRDD